MAHPMQDCTILHIALCADADGVDIAPEDGIHPDAGVLAQSDVSDELSGVIDVAACWNNWSYALVDADHATDFTPETERRQGAGLSSCHVGAGY
jgi:hypothetical protein